MAAMADATPEQMEEGMKPWMAWKEKAGDSIVEMGSSFCASQKITPAVSGGNCSNMVTGFSFVKADNMDEARKLFESHPHLTWDPSCWVEVHETASMG